MLAGRFLRQTACRLTNSTRPAYARLCTVAADAGAAEAAASAAKAAEAAATAAKEASMKTAAFWGTLGAMANWGLAGSAMYDAYFKGPEIISLNMTCVQIGYSALFARWAWVVQPRNLLLMACHVTNVCAQTNQLRRCIEYKLATDGPNAKADIEELGKKAGVFVTGVAAFVVSTPMIHAAFLGSSLPGAGFITAAAGPLTTHFWAPMSKWLISGASMLDINRPTDKISLSQYTALTATGAIFSRYALAVSPVNYMLCSVNIALFFSSAWMLGRKVKADYM